MKFAVTTPNCIVQFEDMFGLVPSFYDTFWMGDIGFFNDALQNSGFRSHCGIAGPFCWGFDKDHLSRPEEEEDDHCIGCGACDRHELCACPGAEEEDE
jgi:hypothetical protein